MQGEARAGVDEGDEERGNDGKHPDGRLVHGNSHMVVVLIETPTSRATDGFRDNSSILRELRERRVRFDAEDGAHLHLAEKHDAQYMQRHYDVEDDGEDVARKNCRLDDLHHDAVDGEDPEGPESHSVQLGVGARDHDALEAEKGDGHQGEDNDVDEAQGVQVLARHF